MLGEQARYLLKFQRRNVLEFGGTDICTTDSEPECLDPAQSQIGTDKKRNEKFAQLLTGYQPQSIFEKKLILGIIHRVMHKNQTDNSRPGPHGGNMRAELV